MVRIKYERTMKGEDGDMKRIVSVLCIAMMLILSLPMRSLAAENPTWTTEAYLKWNYQNEAEGTDVTVTFSNETHILRVDGVGALPSYTTELLGQRPWHGMPIWYIEIGSGITSIGANAFCGYPLLMSVQMYANTFIEDANAFWGAREKCIFTIRGMNIQSRNMGNIPYTSLDSIVTFMLKHNGYYHYQMENYYMIGMAQNNTSPRIQNIAPLSMSTEMNPLYPLIDYTSVITSPMYGENVELIIDGRRQGPLAYEAFSILLGDNTFVNAYNVSVKNRHMIYKTEVPYIYTMTVPKAYVFPGRTFSLIQIANGACNVLIDVDSSDETVTFITDTPTGVYALVYKDTVAP